MLASLDPIPRKEDLSNKNSGGDRGGLRAHAPPPISLTLIYRMARYYCLAFSRARCASLRKEWRWPRWNAWALPQGWSASSMCMAID